MSRAYFCTNNVSHFSWIIDTQTHLAISITLLNTHAAITGLNGEPLLTQLCFSQPLACIYRHLYSLVIGQRWYLLDRAETAIFSIDEPHCHYWHYYWNTAINNNNNVISHCSHQWITINRSIIVINLILNNVNNTEYHIINHKNSHFNSHHNNE